LAYAGGAALAIVLARAAGKIAGVMLIAPLGGLSLRQSLGLACSLMPMSTLALMLQNDVARHFPEFGQELTVVFLAAVLIMEIMGPIATQWGLRLAGDTEPETVGSGTTTRMRAPAWAQGTEPARGREAPPLS